MKKKTFITSLAGSLLVLLCAASAVFFSISRIQHINTNEISTKLYAENGKILQAMINYIEPENIAELKLPKSWAEIIVVDNASLSITEATTAEHKGQQMFTLPALLDQGKDVMDAIDKNKPGVVSTAEYMIVLRPLGKKSTMVAFKPKAYEKSLVYVQRSETKGQIYQVLMYFGVIMGIGLIIAIVVAMFLAKSLSQKTGAMSQALDELSMGNLDAEPPADTKDTEIQMFNLAYLRIRASLNMALSRLKDN